MKKLFVAVLLGAALPLLGTHVFAGDAQPAAGESAAPKGAESGGACKADAEKVCSGMKPGDGKLGPCLKEHQDELSPECKAKIGKMMKGMMKKKGQEACGEDSKSFCADMKPGDGKWGACMKEHKDDLSEGCKAFLGKAKKMGDRMKAKNAEKAPQGNGAKGSEDQPPKDMDSE
jgi:hypothetical protein